MLIGGIVFGLVLGLIAGGSIGNLAKVELRWVGLLMFAVILRFGTEFGLLQGNSAIETFRLPLFALSFVLLLAALWVNRPLPGMRLAFVGILSNTIAIAANGGHMPIWIRSLEAANFTRADINSPFHTVLGADADLDFFLHAGPLGDIIPIPLPVIQNVASIGDLFLTAGLAFFLFATIVRRPGDTDGDADSADAGPLTGLAGAHRLPRGIEAALGSQRIRPGTGLVNSLADAASLDRPLVLGGTGTGLAGPSRRALLGRVRGADGEIVDVWGSRRDASGRPLALAPVPVASTAGAYDGVAGQPARPRVDVGERVRRHPYVRLALNPSFTSLWTGQMVSLLGDRIHQIALAALVVGLTHSVLAAALVFVAATLPNLFLSPIAGAYVDRWNHRDVMIVSDLLRAAVVLIMPDCRDHECLARLSVDLPHDDDLDLLPAGPRRDPAADRVRRRPADRQLGAVGGRDVRRHRRLSPRRPLRGLPRIGPAARVLDRCRDVWRLGDPDRIDRRTGGRARPRREAGDERRWRRRTRTMHRRTPSRSRRRRAPSTTRRPRPASSTR